MRDRERVLQSLETVYRTAYEAAQAAADSESMARLDFEYQRDQLHLEVLLDIRALLGPDEKEAEGSSLLEKAQKLRQITRLKMP